jgi:hypothetical protein
MGRYSSATGGKCRRPHAPGGTAGNQSVEVTMRTRRFSAAAGWALAGFAATLAGLADVPPSFVAPHFITLKLRVRFGQARLAASRRARRWV